MIFVYCLQGGQTVYQALYRKWRPKTFSDVVGQEHITSTLKRQVAEGRLSHAYLFTGTRGTGKTTCAKILAKAVNCENPQDGDPCNACPSCLGIDSGAFMDVTELDAASNNGVDSVRALRDEAIYSPAQVKKRVYIIDEVHMLSTAAFNALLKILEEPPEHLIFILATTELHKVLPTILSRCQRFAFKRILPRDIETRLNYVAREEGIDLKSDGAELLARLSDGALRDALSLLDQCASTGGSIDAQNVLDTLGLAGNVQTAKLLSFVLQRDAKSALLLLNQLYSGGKDVGALLGELSTLARDLLIYSTAPEGGAALLSGGYDDKTLKALQKSATNARIIRVCTVLQETSAALFTSVNPRTDAELCMIRLCDDSLSGDLSALNARISRMEELLAASASLRRSAAAPEPEPPAAEPEPPAAEPEPPEPEEVPESAPNDKDTPPWIAEPSIEDVPPWVAEPSDEDAPPPYSEPVEAPEEAEPAPERKASATPAKAKPANAGEDDGRLFAGLIENYKNRLPVPLRAFVGMSKGRYADGILTVYCGSDLSLHMLDTPDAAKVIGDVTAQSLGEPVTVRFVVGEPPGEPHDRMQDLLQIGSTFGNFKTK